MPENNPVKPSFDVVVACCHAGLVHHDGSVNSAFPPAAWRLWLRFRCFLSARYKAQVLNALRYARDNPQPAAFAKRQV